MPATAGRVRMPANNRVHSSAALQTHGIWQSAIGYDPYAPNKDDSKNSSNQVVANAEPEGENAYASFQGLLALARITGSNADEARGACRKCGRVGHLTFQCKNLVSLKEIKEKEPEAVIQAAVLNGLDKLKGGKVSGKKEVESEESDEEEESESSDSDVDSEIERIIAERYGKKVSSKPKKSSKRKKKNDASDESDSECEERKKRGRSKRRTGKKRGSSDSEYEDESRRKRRKEKRRKRDDTSDEDENSHHRKRKSRKEKRRRRSHRSPDDSESSDMSNPSVRQHRRKSHRDDDVSSSDDRRVGRVAKRSDERSRKRRHEYDK